MHLNIIYLFSSKMFSMVPNLSLTVLNTWNGYALHILLRLLAVKHLAVWQNFQNCILFQYCSWLFCPCETTVSSTEKKFLSTFYLKCVLNSKMKRKYRVRQNNCRQFSSSHISKSTCITRDVWTSLESSIQVDKTMFWM